MKVLLVEDSESLSEALTIAFQRESYVVTRAYDGETGLNNALNMSFDIIILDVMMPKLSGFEVIKRLREKDSFTPVIMLTALTQENSKVEGLNLGADDYVAKPFSLPELLARMRALLRTKSGAKGGGLEFGNVRLKEGENLLEGEEKSVKLSQKEFEILKFLMEKSKIVAKKEDLLTQVWGYQGDSESNSLEVFISFLRKKLAFVNADFNIIVVRGVGYQLSSKLS